MWWAGSLAVVAAAMILGSAPAVHAHALVASSTPAAGSVLPVSPTEVRVTFTETPDPTLSWLMVLDGSGRPHQRGKATAQGRPATLRVAVGRLAPGAYSVAWATVSAVDGHLSSGTFTFAVGTAAAGATAPAATVTRSPSPSGSALAARWLLYSGAMTMLGAAVFRLVAMDATSRRLRVLAVGAAVVLAAGVVAITAAAAASSGVGLSQVLSSSLGHQLVLRGVPAAAAVGAVVLLLAAPGERRWPAAVLAFVAAAVMAGDVTTSHAAGPEPWRWLNLGAQWVHFAAAGVWVGGLAALVVVVGTLDGPARRRALRRFSVAAAAALALVAASGAQRAVSEVGGWGRLWSATFGRWVLVKVGLFAVLVALGALNHWRITRRRDQSPAALRRVAGLELMLVAVALVAAASLQGLVPPAATAIAGPALPTRPGEQTVTTSIVLGLPTEYTVHLTGGNSVQVYIDPGVAGVLNAMHHTYLAADGSELTIVRATVLMTGPGRTRSHPLLTQLLDRKGHFASDVTGRPGSYRFEFNATTAGGTELKAHLDLRLRAPR